MALRIQFTGTHREEFVGNPPTGKRIDYLSNELYRIADGKIAEEWICSDVLTLMTQIGAIPAKQLFSMWLAGYRFWLGASLGIAAGVVLTLLVRLVFP